MKILLFANTAWYLYNFRLPLAETLRSQGHDVVLVSPEDMHVRELARAGFRWVEFQFSRKGRNPFRELVTLIKLVKLYRDERPDLVHHFTVKCVLYGSLAAKWIGISRIVNSITGLGYLFVNEAATSKLMRPFICFLYRMALRSTRVIFQNKDDLHQFQKNGLVDSEMIDIVRGSGVDTQKFKPSPFPGGVLQVLLPARMLWDKGVGEFVEAARIILGEGLQAKFVLAGDTDTENPAGVPMKILQKWQKEGLINWLGWQSNMPELYAASNIVCLPSYREGLPKTLIEAASCGRPLVAFDAPGCREVVIHGKTGFLAKYKDANDLANCLKNLLNDPKACQRMGGNARKLAVEDFSNERILNETLSVYSKLQGDMRKK